MAYRPLRARSPQLIAGLGAALFLVAAGHHANEIYALNSVVGPVVAFVLDGVPALGLVYAGYWLSETDLSIDDRWRVWIWCLLGGVLFVSVMGVSLLVRAFEGRVIGEPVFPLLIAAEVGALAGVIAGYQTVRARRETRRAQAVSDALEFVNRLIRHDLRNDLSVIEGRAELIDAGDAPADAEAGPGNASIIAGKADEALTRIETSRAVAKTLTDDPDLECVDLAAITAEMLPRVEEAFDLTVTADLPDRAPVTANAGLRSVVDNLFENAAEHNDADEPRMHVEVAANAETVRLSIADNGPGIPDERKERLFDPRSENGRDGGLSLVRSLVEGYGGSVWVEDNDPRGSVFVVELPRANDTPDQGGHA